MSENLFPIFGTEIAPLIGRETIMSRLIGDLTKASPSHLSIVGPRFSGKSVIIKALAEKMAATGSPYQAVILMDLGHQTPENDESFLKLLCSRLGKELKACGRSDYGDHLLSVRGNEYDELREVIGALKEESVKILMLWDGFDRPLAKGRLTRNLWDQLRELASNSNLRLVTATRKTLHELIRSEESATSDFWNIFDMTPAKVEKFDEQDREKIISSRPGLKLSEGARTELENWTSGYPPIYLEILNQIIKLKLTAEITNEHVNEVATKSTERINGVLATMWEDCSEPSKSIYRHLVERSEVLLAEVGPDERNTLLERGFAKLSGNKLLKTNRMLEKFVTSLGVDPGSVARLFGSDKEYQRNIRSVLELRLGQLRVIDEKLRHRIKRSIEDIPENPEVCIENIRGIVDRALDIIWDVELGPKREISKEWFEDWKHNGEKGAEFHWEYKFPSTKRGHQIRLLQLMTGTGRCAAKAKRVTKNTYALANALQGFGDFGQHLEGAKVPLGVAVSVVTMSIELAARLSAELL